MWLHSLKLVKYFFANLIVSASAPGRSACVTPGPFSFVSM